MRIAVAGGTYREICLAPPFKQFYGSAGRAAGALSGAVDVELHTYRSKEIARELGALERRFALKLVPHLAAHNVSFEYIHGLLPPTIHPHPLEISRNLSFHVSAENVLRFGMMEGSAIIDGRSVVYDPQSEVAPEPFRTNGSKAVRLALVLNRGEAFKLSGQVDPAAAARCLIASEGADAVFVKCGADGALVVDSTGEASIPAFFAQLVNPIGSGDIFSALIALHWGVRGCPAPEAAAIASMAVAHYVENRTLPVPEAATLKAEKSPPVSLVPGRVYLAGPFFTLAQRRVIEEARTAIAAPGLEVFSPLHEIGLGTSSAVAEADLEGLRSCDRVFAVLDGLDPGTLFEVGYARARDIPVFCYSETVPDKDLTMFAGSGCVVLGDFVTAIYRTQWKR